MPVFPSRRWGGSRFSWSASIRRQPALLFGVPFVLTIVAASFGLKALTQTRYDLERQRTSQISKEEELHMNKNRKKVDIREEYFRLQAPDSKAALDDWEPVRIQRPEGTPEWGVPPPSPSESPSTVTSQPKSPPG